MATPENLQHYQALIAPGTPLRDGLERIVHGRTGALIVLGNDDEVRQVSSGGFHIDVEYSASALRELSKLDGGIILSEGLDRIVRAGVHFVPRGDLPTPETGTRHRSADRVSRQTGVPVVTVSASMSTITLFLDGVRYPVEPAQLVLARTNQALTAMFSHRVQIAALARTLNVLEIQDQASVVDVVRLAQQVEYSRRLEIEVLDALVVLGVEGRLLGTQLAEVSQGRDEMAELLRRDYLDKRPTQGLEALSDQELLDLVRAAEAFGFGSQHLDTKVQAHGYRQLQGVPRVTEAQAEALLGHFGHLQEVLAATSAQLAEVEGISVQQARSIRDGLMRMTESALLEPGFS
ncbi:DNA integrity scanning diadenylate cyclase DisA [Propionibacteriaceae bacterium Y1923]|uniref:DNA integrity scanning diadenylate cyclase DisA n=1 Tax=Aestuariimicrobium sp. Y1814 TaxID=3418742 RepID=UPI003C1A15BC